MKPLTSLAGVFPAHRNALEQPRVELSSLEIRTNLSVSPPGCQQPSLVAQTWLVTKDNQHASAAVLQRSAAMVEPLILGRLDTDTRTVSGEWTVRGSAWRHASPVARHGHVHSVWTDTRAAVRLYLAPGSNCMLRRIRFESIFMAARSRVHPRRAD